MQHSQENPFVSADIATKVDDIMAAARSRFGHGQWFMEAAGGDAGAGDGGEGGDTGADDTDADKGADKGGDDAGDKGETFDRAYVEKLRKENADHRTKAKAAEDRAKAILKAAGLEEDEPDTAKLTTDLTEAQQARRDAAAELVVWRNATALKVDPQAVTDSRAFERAIKDLDPTDAGAFEEAVKKAAQAAAEQNPKLKAAPAAGKGGAELNGGSGEGAKKTTPKSLGDAMRKHYDA